MGSTPPHPSDQSFPFSPQPAEPQGGLGTCRVQISCGHRTGVGVPQPGEFSPEVRLPVQMTQRPRGIAHMLVCLRHLRIG